jgi:hypothetical protein
LPGLESRGRAHRLHGEGPTIDQEEHSSSDPRLHQPVDLIDESEGLASASGHRHEQGALVIVISKGGNSRRQSGALQLTGSDLVTEARERSCSGGGG